MQSTYFWKNWSSPFRELYTALLLVFAVLFLSLFYYYIIGIEGVLGWSVLAKSESVKLLVENLTIGPFSLQSTADGKVFMQSYLGNMPEVNVLANYIFLGIVIFCFNLLFAISTTLKKFWYFVATSLLIIFLVNLKMELLLLFGSEYKIGLIVALCLYLPVSFIFNSIKSEVSFGKRLLSFIGITLFLGLFIGYGAEFSHPFLHLAAYSWINAFLITLIFTLMVAHEIVAAFIYLLTRSKNTTGGNSLRHFAIITLIYLVNLFLTYLHETNVLDWDILYVNLFILLAISTLLGIWSYGSREEQYGNLYPFNPIGGLLFITLAILAFSTITQLLVNGNDPGIEVIRDFIIYGHLGYGIIFVVYIIANFLDPLKRNLQVFKVLYKPTSMPYFTFRLAGLIAFLAFLLKSSWEVPVNQSMAAHYNNLADLHMEIEEPLVAKHYYTQGAVFGYNNHKSNYALAALSLAQKNNTEAIEFFEKASAKNPAPQDFVNWSSLQEKNDKFFEALFTLEKAKEIFPENGPINNNIGLLYAKTRMLDSAAYFIDQATNDRFTDGTASSNMLSLLAINDIPIPPDSIKESYDIENDPISINNTLILKNKLHIPANEEFYPSDSGLSLLQASIYYNVGFNYLFRQDTLDTEALIAYGNYDSNLDYREDLQFAAALNMENRHEVAQAFRQVNWLANTSARKSADFFNTLGLWALKYEAPYVASSYFNLANERGLESGKLHQAIALTEQQELAQAGALWNELLKSKDRNEQIIAGNLLNILSLTPEKLSGDLDRYYYLRYHLTPQDSLQFDRLVDQIEDPNYKAQAIFDFVKKLWKRDKEASAIQRFRKLEDVQVTSEVLFDQIQRFELRMLAAQGNVRGMAQKINQGIEFSKEQAIEKHYFTALVNEYGGDTLNARKNYAYIANKNPFYPESIIAAANFYNVSDKFKAYQILINALDINPRSIRLLKAYILQCARIENETYAEISLNTLRELITAEEFSTFEAQYEQLKTQVKLEAENF